MVMVHKKRTKGYDVTIGIIEYEEGKLNDEQTIELFQHLLDTGMCWSLQGHYGRTAMAMLEAGLLIPPKKPQKDYYGNVIDFSRFNKKIKIVFKE
jgi:hypothetical protein